MTYSFDDNKQTYMIVIILVLVLCCCMCSCVLASSGIGGYFAYGALTGEEEE